MKKTLWVLVAALILLAAVGCSPKSESADYDLTLLSEEIKAAGEFTDMLSPVDMNMAKSLYGFDETKVTESVLLCSTGATTEEIGLFKCADEASASELKTIASNRVISQREAYESYAPAEMPKLDDAVVLQKGKYVFYVVSGNSTKVEEIINK